MDVGRRRRGYALEIPRCSGNPLEPDQVLKHRSWIGLATFAQHVVVSPQRPSMGRIDLDAHRQCHVSSR